ncbi:MAG: MgtC/SapB family protein [Acidobacteriota bacterium]
MDNFLEFILQDGLRLGLAVVLGGVIGLEREAADKPAGLRTNILICVGSTLMMMLSIRVAHQFVETVADPARIAQGVITGVGFLGAGTILHARGGVTGLTTAATTWALAGIGLAVGSGYYRLAVMTTLLILVVLWILGRISHLWGGPRESRTEVRIVADGPGSTLDEVREILKKAKVSICAWNYERLADGHCVVMQIDARRKDLPRLLTRISTLEGIRSAGDV